MRRGTIVAVLVAVAAFLPLRAPAAATEPAVAHEEAFVARINTLRATKGLSPLTADTELTDVARRWADAMTAKGDISHNRGLARQVEGAWKKLGENVGMGPDVDDLHTAFVRSPSHYENLVDPAYDRIGVGVAVDEAGTIFTTHVFMAAKDRKAAPRAAPMSPRIAEVLVGLRALDGAA